MSADAVADWVRNLFGQKGKLAGLIDLLVIGGFLAVIFYALSADGAKDIAPQVWQLIGTLGTLAVAVVTFHRGSSQGSKDKTPPATAPLVKPDPPAG